MITATVNDYGIMVQGHAGHKGGDPTEAKQCCEAVGVLCQTLAACIDPDRVARKEKGLFIVTTGDLTDKEMALTEFFLTGLELVAAGYPHDLKINFTDRT